MTTSFYSYQDLFGILRPHLTDKIDADEFYTSAIEMHYKRGDASAFGHAHWEYAWRKLRRPYYRVYPGAIKLLLGLDLGKILCRSVERPAGLDAMIVDMPKGNALMDDGQDVRHLMIEFNDHANVNGRMVTFGVHYGETGKSEQTDILFPVWDTWYMALENDKGVEDVLEYIEVAGEKVREEHAKLGYHTLTFEERYRLSSLLCMLCMLDEDPRLVSPDVLVADEAKVTPETLANYVGKAKRRGKVGWSVGRSLHPNEVSPHFRNPHPCIFWVDPGRTRQLIRIRSHSFPGLNKVLAVPTGYKDDDSPPEV